MRIGTLVLNASSGAPFVDLSRKPTQREAAALAKRKQRVVDAEQSRTAAMSEMQRLADLNGLEEIRLRDEFIRRATPAPRSSYSDRSAVSPEDRPASTRLMSPNGIALKLILIALFEAQSRTKPGQKPDGNPTPLVGRSTSEHSWSRYIASGARASGEGKHRMGSADKKLRTLRDTLDRLETEGLIDCPRRSEPKDKQEGFLLNREDAMRGQDGAGYRVPADGDVFFTVPVTLFTNGWIYVLEDSELALLLIGARLRRRHGDSGQRLSGAARVLHYGLSRDAFSAHRMLDNIKLMEVLPDEARWIDGRHVEDYAKRGSKPHSLRFLPEGLEENGPSTLLAQIDYQLGRL